MFSCKIRLPGILDAYDQNFYFHGILRICVHFSHTFYYISCILLLLEFTTIVYELGISMAWAPSSQQYYLIGDKARLASLRTTTSTVKRRIEEEKETDKIKENIPLGPS